MLPVKGVKYIQTTVQIWVLVKINNFVYTFACAAASVQILVHNDSDSHLFE